MAKKSFLLVSLKEDKAKKLAEVISNKTCRRMLDFLAEKKDATESEIAKELKIPISTVHYNMKALLTAKLVKCDEYHYSSKGKEVNHYRLANQYVIIAPEGEKHMLREKLKSIIPTALIMGAAAAIIKIFSGTFGAAQSFAAPAMMKAGIAEDAAYETAEILAAEAPAPTMNAAQDAGSAAVQQAVAERAPEALGKGAEVVSQMPEIALWFFIGAVTGVVVYLLVEWIVKKVRER